MSEHMHHMPQAEPSHAEQDPYASLRLNPEILGIEPRGGFNVVSPDRLDFQVFGETGEEIAEMYQDLYEWLHKPFIEDSLPDHSARRALRDAMSGSDRALFKESKYRNNPATSALLEMGDFVYVLNQTHSLIGERVNEFLNQEPSLAYFNDALPRTLEHDARKTLLESLETKVVGVMNIVAGAASSEKKSQN